MHTENTQAVLLLTCYFSKPRKDEVKPLSVAEYARFAEWLHGNRFLPSSLFSDFDDIFGKWKDPKKTVTGERVKALLDRGMAMGLALDKWQKAGIWLLTRSDSDYPARLKKRLGTMSPPVIFGVGNKNLLESGGLAVVGSRGIGEDDSQFTQTIGTQAAKEGINIVSGGARGVDETAMLAALNAEGTAIGILADSLLKAALAGKWRRHLQKDNLVLISTYYPEAGFNAGNAMGRNKYIYCLSDHALVVRSDKDKGGTWSGAKENLNKGWVPLLVKPSEVDGNSALLQMGGQPLEIPSSAKGTSGGWLADFINGVAASAESIGPVPDDNDLFSGLSVAEPQTEYVPEESVQEVTAPVIEDVQNIPESVNDPFFHLFTEKLRELLESKPNISLADLKPIMSDLNARQISDWLDRAESEKLVERKGRSRTYQLAG
ncbi:DNA-processing protein DprA [Endozoicomonas euniceicola]|uniref:DNA-protecting protein DprA n=1 Tax=Endozoicomonas euniceicola TaxID=1234143 RepID=A0ABY6GRU4_9GAMM|nr:DNA-processing protein DprA [Endozoicomonas euniceicola]UYM15468.1 DNA-protecting protein DprA [Endozoicomonas euniceicola]